MFGNEEQNHNEDYKIPTIISFNSLPHLSIIREQLSTILGEKSKNLNAEGNKYFHNKSGIGFHGDAERTRVICLSLGADNYPIRWIWYYKNKSVGDYYEIKLNSGDVYIMSEKAVGQEWKKSSIYTLRHAAGSDKYINIKNK